MKHEHANVAYFIFITGIVAVIFGLNGCATQSKSTALGGAIGMGTGAAIGGIVDPGNRGEYRTRNVVIGAALGGVAGMIAGSTLHGTMESQNRAAFERGSAQVKPSVPGEKPTLTEPKVEAYWVEGRVGGNRYIDAHWEYQILEPARWEKK